MLEEILKEARSHYKVEMDSDENFNWNLKLYKDKEVVFSISDYNFDVISKGIKVFLDSNEKIFELEEKIRKDKNEQEMNKFNLEKELKKERNRLKYADKISIPKEPLNKNYIPSAFSTYATCPTCGAHVEDGMGRKDEKCKECDQILLW